MKYNENRSIGTLLETCYGRYIDSGESHNETHGEIVRAGEDTMTIIDTRKENSKTLTSIYNSSIRVESLLKRMVQIMEDRSESDRVSTIKDRSAVMKVATLGDRVSIGGFIGSSHEKEGFESDTSYSGSDDYKEEDDWVEQVLTPRMRLPMFVRMSVLPIPLPTIYPVTMSRCLLTENYPGCHLSLHQPRWDEASLSTATTQLQHSCSQY